MKLGNDYVTSVVQKVDDVFTGYKTKQHLHIQCDIVGFVDWSLFTDIPVTIFVKHKLIK